MDFELIVVFVIFLCEESVLVVFDGPKVDDCAAFGVDNVTLLWHLMDFDSRWISGYFYLERSERFLSRVDSRALWELLLLRFLRL